jgi:phenylalanyl-tRNA synthetase beta chain
MPSISISINDFSNLLGREVPSGEWLEEYLSYVKGEVKSFTPLDDEAKIELNDTNRPDLWCPEGIARQIRTRLQGTVPKYPFLKNSTVAGIIDVDLAMVGVRPYISAFIAKGPAITDGVLRQLIQTQEKLSDTFGRKRKSVATGVYKLDKISFPVRYGLVADDDFSFIPLGMNEEMTTQEIMGKHPTAIEYAPAVEGYSALPLLTDSCGAVLSMPPIINSALVGAVEVGDCNLFVEVTGLDIRQTLLAANIFAANLADRGFEIGRVETRYPYETLLGSTVVAPSPLGQAQEVALSYFNEALGESFDASQVAGKLTAFGLSVDELSEGRLRVRPPFYRNDLLHPIDVVEDLAISHGYNNFKALLPSDYTVGRLTSLESFSDRLRGLMVEAGFTEILSPILTHPDKLAQKMRLPGRRIVTIDNVMSENYSVLRDAVLPSLLEVESVSAHATYPHMIFEVGEICVRNPSKNRGTQTLLNCGAAIFEANAGFSDIHSYLDRLFFFLDLDYKLKTRDHLTAIPGRSARIIVDGKDVGGVGELHPEVLDNWGIKMPCSAFEINLEKVMEALGIS